jgi:hypothetical protein
VVVTAQVLLSLLNQEQLRHWIINNTGFAMAFGLARQSPGVSPFVPVAA